MRIRLLGAALAAALVASLVAAPAARADILRLRDGKVLPAGAKVVPGEAPSDDQMEQFKDARVEPLAYDVVKIGGISVSPGMIEAVWIHDAWFNADFVAGDRAMAGNLLDDAADEFRKAADDLKGNAKQMALWKRAYALAAANDADGMLPAIEDLLAQYPKSYFLGDVQQRRARVLAGKGQLDEAKAALDKVSGATGMNRRDLHDAELLKVFLTQYIGAGRDTARWAAAEQAYRERLKAIEADMSVKAEVEPARLKALVGIGRCLVFQNKPTDAQAVLVQVTSSSDALNDKAMLASAYNGLGDVLWAEASATQAKAAGNDDLKKKAVELLENALLQYLRVTELYYVDADRGDLFQARLGAARVFALQFTSTGDKDCEAGKKGLSFYVGASKLLSPGMLLQEVTKEWSALKARVDKACK